MIPLERIKQCVDVKRVSTCSLPLGPLISLLLFLGFQTANLDGETNLKIRKALEKTWDYVTPDKASEFKGLTFEHISLQLILRSSF